jgi:hypothetical protein
MSDRTETNAELPPAFCNIHSCCSYWTGLAVPCSSSDGDGFRLMAHGSCMHIYEAMKYFDIPQKIDLDLLNAANSHITAYMYLLLRQ